MENAPWKKDVSATSPDINDEKPKTQSAEMHMRVPLLEANNLTPKQRPIYEDMRAGIEENFRGFQAIGPSGALLGPWNPWLHEPKFGQPIWELTKALAVSPSLPGPVREVAILVTGAKFRAGYELYAHVIRRRATRACG